MSLSKSKTTLLTTLLMSVVSINAHANIFGNIFGAVTGNDSHGVTQPTLVPTRHQAYMNALHSEAKAAGYVPQSGANTTVIIGDPVDIGLVNDDALAVARMFGVAILPISLNGFRNITYTHKGHEYKGSLNSSIIQCDGTLSVCKFHGQYFPKLEENPQSIGSFIALNALWDQKLAVQNVFSELSTVRQPGLNGPNKIYIFFDPDCSVCWHEFHLIQDNLTSIKKKYPNISIEWVPTDIFRANKSAGRSEQSLQGGFPAIRDDFNDFNMQTETGGLTGTPIGSLQNSIAYNVAADWYLSLKYGVNGQPQSRDNISTGTPTCIGMVNGTPKIVFVPPPAFFSAVNNS